MRHVIMVCALVMLCGLADAQDKGKDKKDVPKDLAQFQGTWKVVKAEFEGKEPKEKVPADMRVTFKGDRMTVKEGAKNDDDGKYIVNSKKTPAEIDLVSDKGDKIAGIYKFDKDGKLSLCFSKGKGAVRPKSFDTKNTMAGLLVLEKVKEKEKE
jgi:uncharacterized protein (TIGR03067 family)